MHYQIIVVYPADVELDDVMYNYAEVDKDTNGRIKDERCQFILQVKEKDIPNLLKEIKEYFEKKKNEYLEMLQYRSKSTVEEFKQKYGNIFDFYKLYIESCDTLIEYCEVKDLPFTDPRQIRFIKEWGDYAADKWTEIYIPGVGYGFFDNPYELCDYYRVLKVSNEINYVGEMFVIFCEKDPMDSRIYTTDDIRFNKEYNKHCRVDNLEDKVSEISGKIMWLPYLVAVLDIHM
jgi:hypothetical protein